MSELLERLGEARRGGNVWQEIEDDIRAIEEENSILKSRLEECEREFARQLERLTAKATEQLKAKTKRLHDYGDECYEFVANNPPERETEED